jgi:hypothetical protein
MRPQQLETENDQSGADRDQERVTRNRPRDRSADDGTDDRGRCHQEEERPVDPSGSDVRDRSSKRRHGRDPDVRSRPRGRAGRGQHDHGQPDVPEDKTDQAAGQCREEAPKSNGDEDEGVQALEYRA